MEGANVENYAIERLTALLAAGYEMWEVHSPSDAVTLEHPDKSFKARHVYVYADGKMVAPMGAADEVRVFADSPQDEFYCFVRSVPQPTWWQRTLRMKAWLFGSMCVALGVLGAHLLSRLLE